MEVQPYNIQVPEETLTDLQERLARTRWPDEISGSGWDYGTNLAYLKELVDYWRNGFDWRAQEKLINTFAHYRTQVDGLGIHFIHEKGTGPNPLPIVVTHGWPGTFFEMHKILPLLTDPGSHGGDPADSFNVVAPSMPGYGFSDHPNERGLHVLRVSDLWTKLMTEGLGYNRFGAHGGDWGASVTAYLGYAYPQHLIGIHLTSMSSPAPYLGAWVQGTDRSGEGTSATKGGMDSRRGRIRAHSRHQATDPVLRAERLPGGAGWLDRGEVPLLERLRRRCGEQVYQGRAINYHHHLLGNPNHQFFHPPLL